MQERSNQERIESVMKAFHRARNPDCKLTWKKILNALTMKESLH